MSSTTTAKILAKPNERYAPGCFDRSIGQEVTVHIGTAPVSHGRLTAYEVAEDGSHVWITVETP